MRVCYWFFILAVWGILFAGFAHNTSAIEKLPVEQLEKQIPQWMEDWRVPGMAIAIVHRGEVILASGYGVQKVGTEEAVDADTLFAIGSITKAFTSTALGILVDRGQLTFDTVVSDILPIKWNDETLTREITIRDLLAHRSGLDKVDFAWYKNGRSREDLLKILEHIPSKAPFRSTFHYNNLTYLVAGQIIPQLTGRSWDQFVQEELLQPLNMTRTFTGVSQANSQSNVATPHIIQNDVLIPIERENNENAAPAGAIYSSANDMCQWLTFWLDKGTPLISEMTSHDILSPHCEISMKSIYAMGFPMTSKVDYGLGWFLYDYKGHQVFEHSGKADGMMAQLTIIPDQELGIIILTNSNNLGLPMVMKYTFLDAFFETQMTFDWHQHALAGVKTLQAAKEKKENEIAEKREHNTPPKMPLGAYCGVYTNSLYGELTITYQNNALHASMKPFHGKITHWEKDIFFFDLTETMPEEPLKALLRFEDDAKRLIFSAEETPAATFERKVQFVAT